jgi:hypothetical protein
MKKCAISFAGIVVCMLSACGGGSTSGSASEISAANTAPASVATPIPASTPQMASTPVIQIDVFGDDAAMGVPGYGFGMPPLIKPPSATLQDDLQNQFRDTGISVVNRAAGGRAASLMDLLDGMDGGGPPFSQRLASTKSSIIISYAINDAYGGETVSDFSGYLGQAIQTVLDAKRIPVLEEPGPTCDTDHPRLAQYVAAIDAAGKAYGVPVIANYGAILSLPDWRRHMDATCVLPDEALDAFKAQQESAVVTPILKSLIGE